MSSISLSTRQQHLDVVQIGATSELELERELAKIDRDLHLDKEWDAEFERFCYRVILFLTSDVPPKHITDWRDPRTREPLELSYGLLSKVRQQEAQNLALAAKGRTLVAEALRENEERQRKLADENQRHYLETALDMIPRIRGTKGIIMPRTKNVHAAAMRQRRRDIERRMGLR